MESFEPVYNKIFLLRTIYPYLKILKNNPNIFNRKIVEMDLSGFSFPSFYVYEFEFRPFNQPFKGAKFHICLDFKKNSPYYECIYDHTNIISSIALSIKLIYDDTYINQFKYFLENFYSLAIQHFYDHNIDIFESIIKTAIPEHVLYTDEKASQLYKSLRSINKFNL